MKSAIWIALAATVEALPKSLASGYEGKKLVRVQLSEANQDKFHTVVEGQGLDVWKVNSLKGTADVIFDEALDGFTYETVIPDVQGHFHELFAMGDDFMCEKGAGGCVGHNASVMNSGSRIINDDPYYDAYQQLPAVHAKMDEIIRASNLVEAFQIGSSYEDRDIRGFKITGRSGFDVGKQKVVYNCGIHAREWIPPMFCVYLVDVMASQYGQPGFEDVTSLLDAYEVHSIPSLNPDGYHHSYTVANMWRKSRKPNPGSTAIGTDLNRNFAQGWGGGGSSNLPSSDTYRGQSPLDNRESAAIVGYWEQHKPVIMMDIHAYGYMWLQPYGTEPRSSCVGNPRGCGVPDERDYNAQTECGRRSAEAIAKETGAQFDYGPITWVIYQASGGSCDDAYALRGIKYPYTPEVRGNSFQPAPSNIELSNRELYAAAKAQMSCVREFEGF